MRVYVVSSEATVNPDYAGTPECSNETTNVKVFQKLSDAISFVKTYDYLANDCSIESPEDFIAEPDFWTAEDGLLVLYGYIPFDEQPDQVSLLP
jgi:hypothetical protein